MLFRSDQNDPQADRSEWSSSASTATETPVRYGSPPTVSPLYPSNITTYFLVILRLYSRNSTTSKTLSYIVKYILTKYKIHMTNFQRTTHSCDYLISQLCGSSAVHKIMQMQASSFRGCSHQFSEFRKIHDLSVFDSEYFYNC